MSIKALESVLDVGERSLQVLVVDDEIAVRVLLKTVLAAEGFVVDTASTNSSAREMLAEREYDLIMLDHHLPDQKGSDLMADLRRKGVDTPTLLMTAFPSAETLALAFEAGVDDFVTKPFLSLDHLVSRVRLLAHRGISGRLFEQVTADLKDAAARGGPSAVVFTRALNALDQARAGLAERPAALIIGTTKGSIEALRDSLGPYGLDVEGASSLEEGVERVHQPSGPLTLLADLSVPSLIETIRAIKSRDESVEILVTGGKDQVNEALAAVEAGASDYWIRGAETPAQAAGRVRRAVDRARRQRLQLEVVRQIRLAARELGESTDAGLDLSIDVDMTTPTTDGGGGGRPAAASAPASVEMDVRLPVDLAVQLWREGEAPRTGRVRNISRGGLFIAVSHSMEPGDQVRVRIPPQGREVCGAVDATCQVRWVSKEPRESMGMGLKLAAGCTEKLDAIVGSIWSSKSEAPRQE